MINPVRKDRVINPTFLKSIKILIHHESSLLKAKVLWSEHVKEEGWLNRRVYEKT
jgi:hypothetical protein